MRGIIVIVLSLISISCYSQSEICKDSIIYSEDRVSIFFKHNHTEISIDIQDSFESIIKNYFELYNQLSDSQVINFFIKIEGFASRSEKHPEILSKNRSIEIGKIIGQYFKVSMIYIQYYGDIHTNPRKEYYDNCYDKRVDMNFTSNKGDSTLDDILKK